MLLKDPLALTTKGSTWSMNTICDFETLQGVQ